MTKAQEVFERIRAWEMDAGESFVDYFESNIRAVSYMFWCRGKGYVSQEDFLRWEEDYTSNKFEADCANYYVYDDYGLPNRESGEAEKILAEFISESGVYMKRFEEFFEEN